MMTATVQSGFHRTGIFPINPKAIKQSDLGPSTATDNIAQIEGKRNCFSCFGINVTLPVAAVSKFLFMCQCVIIGI